MGQGAATPPGFREQVAKMVEDKLGALLRSGFLRSASIGEGGLTVRGGFIRLVTGAVNLFYAGPGTPAAPDGTPQQVVRIRRADGTIALQVWDAFPGEDGTFNQALSWLDRSGVTVFADDTDSGQGIARPHLGFTAYPSRAGDFLKASGGSFTTLWRAKGPKQHPKLFVEVWVNAADAGAVGEVQIVVNGAVWGAPQPTVPGFVTNLSWGPLPVDGAHMATTTIEVQGRISTGTGNVEVGVARIEGRQT